MAQGLLLSVLAALASGFLLAGSIGSPSVADDLLVKRRVISFAAQVGATGLGRALISWDAWGACVAFLRERLGRGGTYVGRFEATGLLLMAMAAAALGLSLIFGSLLLAPLTVAVALAAVPLMAGELDHRRKAAITDAIPDLLRSLALSLGSGMTLSKAIGYVGERTEGEAGQAFRRASLEEACGMSVSEALEGLESSLDAPGMGLLSCALVVSQRTGAPLDGLLNRSAALVEEQAELAQSLSTKTAQARLSSRVVMLLPVFLILLLSLIMPDYRAGLASPLGIVCLLIAAALDVCAFLVIKRITAEVEL